MAERTIAEVLFLEADLARHDDLIWTAQRLINDHQDHAPRIDSGEWTIRAEEEVEDERQTLNQTEDPPLRPVTIEWDHNVGYWAPFLEPYPRPYPWEKDDG